MDIKSLGSYYQGQLANIQELVQENTLWKAEAADLLARESQGFQNTDDLLQALHEAQRLNKIYTAGVAQDAVFRQKVLGLPMWKDYGTPPASTELQHSLAQKIYNANPRKNDQALINIGDGAREIGVWLADKCAAEHIPFVVQFADPEFQAHLVNHTEDAGVRALAADFLKMTAPLTTIMTARPGVPDRDPPETDKAKTKIYAQETRSFGERISSGDLFYTLTIIPTRKDAEIDEIPYDDYTRLFFEMCDQPWDRIGKAQEALIKEFNAACKVRITNNDGTDVSMELVDHDGSHFTFCNSLIAKNVPGSEIFSAPRRDSVEGTVVAKGRFSEHGKAIIENLTLEFSKGKLIGFSAEKGDKELREILSVDEGALGVGELGIGTNPHLKQHVCNGLLVEKIGGSFHLALGRPYSYTEYMGTPVKVDNGGVSDLHWDITTMLQGKDGRIYLDGRLIMDHGLWLDPQYDILNRGWEAVPENERPAYWKDYYKAPTPQP